MLEKEELLSEQKVINKQNYTKKQSCMDFCQRRKLFSNALDDVGLYLGEIIKGK